MLERRNHQTRLERRPPGPGLMTSGLNRSVWEAFFRRQILFRLDKTKHSKLEECLVCSYRGIDGNPAGSARATKYYSF